MTIIDPLPDDEHERLSQIRDRLYDRAATAKAASLSAAMDDDLELAADAWTDYKAHRLAADAVAELTSLSAALRQQSNMPQHFRI